MDLTIEVMLPPRGDLDFSRAVNGRYRVLAPVAVYELKSPAVVGMQRTGYIHVRDVPIAPRATKEAALQRLNSVLCEVWANDDAERSVRERRKWVGVPARLAVGAVDELLTQRQTTMTWAEFKTLLNHQVEVRTLSDEDIA